MKKYNLILVLIIISVHLKGQEILQKNKIRIINNNLFVEVFVNDKGPYNFIFDSGATGIGRIDKRVVEQLDLKVVDSIKNYDGSGNYRIEAVVRIENLSLGKIGLNNVELMTRDYNKSSKKAEILTDGIIGRDFFADYLLVIDCPNETMTVSKGSLNALSKGVLKYTQPFRINGCVGDIDTLFYIDTGSNLAMHFPKSIMDKLDYENTGKKSIARKANSEYALQEAVLNNKIKLGKIHTKGLLVDYSEKITYINIGMKFLKNYKITFDQKNQLLKIN